MKLLENKIAIITGTSAGIGKSTAMLYAENGAQIVLASRNKEKNEELANTIEKNGGKVIFIQTDVSKVADCENLVKKTISHYGRLDIACNNAGILSHQAPLAEFDPEEWQRIINTNLSGVFYCMRYQIAAMTANNGGCIVNISSILGKVGMKGESAYVASKHGVLGLTKTAALEYSSHNIRINAVGPAFIDTPLLHNNLSKQFMNDLPAQHPMGRIGKAEEVAELVIWLSSSRASFVTGSYFPIDGGYLAQ